MTRDERRKLYREALTAIEGGVHGEFAVFSDSATKRFIQFAPVGAKHYLVEVTDAALSAEEVSRLPAVLDQVKRDEYTSYTTACKLDEAVRLAEVFFHDVCLLSEDFEPAIETETGEVTCDLCGCELQSKDPDPEEIYLGEADELGFKKDVVADLVRASIDAVRSGGVMPDDEVAATCDAVSVDGPVFPVLCPACQGKLKDLRRKRSRSKRNGDTT